MIEHLNSREKSFYVIMWTFVSPITYFVELEATASPLEMLCALISFPSLVGLIAYNQY